MLHQKCTMKKLKNTFYDLKHEGKKLTAEQMVDLYEEWVNNFPIVTIEDGLDEEDWDGWKVLTDRLGKKVQLVGDDLFVTNKELLKKKERR